MPAVAYVPIAIPVMALLTYLIYTADIHLLSPASLNIPLKPSRYASHPVPTLKDFEALWTVWDVVTKTMVPRQELLSRPIKLRNALIFYLGHIPTFFGMLTVIFLCRTHGLTLTS